MKRLLVFLTIVLLTGCGSPEQRTTPTVTENQATKWVCPCWSPKRTPTVAEWMAIGDDQAGDKCERTARDDVNAALLKSDTKQTDYLTELRKIRTAKSCLP